MMQRIQKAMDACVRSCLTKPFTVILLITAVGLRLRHYLENRSFWLDETVTAVAVLNRSWMEIVRQVPLAEGFAKQPLVFCLVEKAAAQWGGNNEWALRALPFLASLASVFVFYAWIKKVTGPSAGVLSLALFALCPPLIYFAAELKPYALDVLAAVCLYWLYETAGRPPFNLKRILWLAGAGALMVWVSHASVFVLAAAGLTAILALLRRRPWRDARYLFPVIAAWAGSFLLLYKIVLKPMAGDEQLFFMWKNSFMPGPFWSFEGLRWLAQTAGNFFVDPAGLGSAVVSAALFGAGVFAVFRRTKDLGVLLAAPMILTLLAAATHRYPFGGRLVLFLVPGAFVLIAEGLVFFSSCLPRAHKWAAFLLTGFIFFVPLKQAVRDGFQGHNRQSNREAVRYFSRNAKSGDAVVLNSEAQFPFWYYTQRYGAARVTDSLVPLMAEGKLQFAYRTGQILDHLLDDGTRPYALFRYVFYVYDDAGHFRKLFSSTGIRQATRLYADKQPDFLPSGRVWFFFSSMDPLAEEFVLYVLNKQGTKLESFEGKGAAVYLYDLGRPQAQPGGRPDKSGS